jgi:hypothetical protein
MLMRSLACKWLIGVHVCLPFHEYDYDILTMEIVDWSTSLFPFAVPIDTIIYSLLALNMYLN